MLMMAICLGHSKFVAMDLKQHKNRAPHERQLSIGLLHESASSRELVEKAGGRLTHGYRDRSRQPSAPTIVFCLQQGDGMHFPLRFAGGMGTETWPFWLDLPAEAPPGALTPLDP